MKRRRQLNRQAQRQALFALEKSPFALVNGGIRPGCPRDNLRGGAQGQSGALNTALLAALLALATGSGANAQIFIGPGPVTGPVEVTLPNSPVTVVGKTTISLVRRRYRCSSRCSARRQLWISTPSSGPSPGPISITSGGTGVASIFPSSPATVSISSGPHGDVTITSGGAALGVSGDVSLAASNANGGTLTFQSTGGFGVVAQFGAKVDITGATDIANSGVGAVLIGGDLTNEGVADAASADLADAFAIAQICPCCGGRMSVVETFARGAQPRSFKARAARIDTS